MIIEQPMIGQACSAQYHCLCAALACHSLAPRRPLAYGFAHDHPPATHSLAHDPHKPTHILVPRPHHTPCPPESAQRWSLVVRQDAVLVDRPGGCLPWGKAVGHSNSTRGGCPSACKPSTTAACRAGSPIGRQLCRDKRRQCRHWYATRGVAGQVTEPYQTCILDMDKFKPFHDSCPASPEEVSLTPPLLSCAPKLVPDLRFNPCVRPHCPCCSKCSTVPTG